jgi:hypothetical protein
LQIRTLTIMLSKYLYFYLNKNIYLLYFLNINNIFIL